MSKSSAFAAIAATIVGVLGLSAPAFADPQPLEHVEHQYYSNRYADIRPGYAEQRYRAEARTASGAPQGMSEQEWKRELTRGPASTSAEQRAHYLTYTGSTEQESNNGLGYLTYGGNTEQSSPVAPQGMTLQQRRAEQIRGQALNKRYGLGAYANQAAPAGVAAEQRGRALNAKYGNAWTKMSPTQFSALVRFFGNDVTQLSPMQLKAFVLHGEQGGNVSGPSSNGFDFRDFGIGVAAALTALVAVAVIRRARRTPTLEGVHGAA